MAKKVKSLRSEEISLHLKIKLKRALVVRLIDELSDLKERISDGKSDLKGLLIEHKEVRALLQEEEGYAW
jgi:hypothetical protein